jgi:hypothetical protein
MKTSKKAFTAVAAVSVLSALVPSLAPSVASAKNAFDHTVSQSCGKFTVAIPADNDHVQSILVTFLPSGLSFTVTAAPGGSNTFDVEPGALTVRTEDVGLPAILTPVATDLCPVVDPPVVTPLVPPVVVDPPLDVPLPPAVSVQPRPTPTVIVVGPPAANPPVVVIGEPPVTPGTPDASTGIKATPTVKVTLPATL